MADANAITLDVAAWLPRGQWDAAPEVRRRRFLAHMAGQATVAKLRELRAGKGVDGKPMARVKPASRPDGATGPPLSPHRPESRSQKWLRASTGKGHVTLWWSHGWGKILGYHARGEVRGAPVRDVLGLTAADLRALQAEARRFWRLATAPAKAPGGSSRLPRVVETAGDRFRARRRGDFRSPWRGVAAGGA